MEGLINIGEKTYYLDPENGKRLTGFQTIQQKGLLFPSEHWLHDSFWLGKYQWKPLLFP